MINTLTVNSHFYCIMLLYKGDDTQTSAFTEANLIRFDKHFPFGQVLKSDLSRLFTPDEHSLGGLLMFYVHKASACDFFTPSTPRNSNKTCTKSTLPDHGKTPLLTALLTQL